MLCVGRMERKYSRAGGYSGSSWRSVMSLTSCRCCVFLQPQLAAWVLGLAESCLEAV